MTIKASPSISISELIQEWRETATHIRNTWQRRGEDVEMANARAYLYDRLALELEETQR